MDFFTKVAIGCTIVPYFFYTWAYKFPKSFSRFFTQKQLIRASVWAKIVGCFCHAPACFRAGINGPGLCLSIPLVIVGQYLNELVYNLLGDSGVYYGIELQAVKPKKIGGFPFTLCDPQYKGSVLTVFGTFLAFNTTTEILQLAIPWIVSYFTIMIVENTKGAIDSKKD